MNYKRQSLVLLLVVVMLLTSVAVVSAQGGLEATVEQFLYVRALPDVKAYDYGRLEPGTTVTLVARTSDNAWLQLELEDGTLGWGRINSVATEGDIESLPVMDVTRANAVVTRFTNLRAAPVIDAGTVTRLEQGAMVSLVASTADGWLFVTSDMGNGWAVPRGFQFTRAAGDDQASVPELPVVNAAVDGYAFTRVLPEMDAASYDRLTPGTPVNVLAQNADATWYQVELLDGATAWATARAFVLADGTELPVAEPDPAQGIVTNFAVLREGPDSTSAEVGQLDAGTAVDLLLVNGNRVYVQAGELVGWTVADALSFVGGSIPDVLSANATVVATVDTVNLRSAPSTDAARLGFASNGERLSVVGVSADGEWYSVVPSSRVGAWIFADLVELDDASVPLPVVE